MSVPTIFLSCSQEDRAWGKAFADALKRHGISLWLNEWDLKPGDDLIDAIDRALRESEALVFLVGPESVGKPSLFFELGAAMALQKRIISVVSEDVEQSKIPAPLLRMRHVVQGDPEETAEEVARAVAA
jgi:TIR domain-containing protein